jgi:hypothetical protein
MDKKEAGMRVRCRGCQSSCSLGMVSYACLKSMNAVCMRPDPPGLSVCRVVQHAGGSVKQNWLERVTMETKLCVGNLFKAMHQSVTRERITFAYMWYIVPLTASMR